MVSIITESTTEEAVLHWLSERGYEVKHRAELVPHERASYDEVVLVGRLREAVARLIATTDQVWTEGGRS